MTVCPSLPQLCRLPPHSSPLRVLHTMVPGLPPPVVSMCLNLWLGPDAEPGSHALRQKSAPASSTSSAPSAAAAAPTKRRSSRSAYRLQEEEDALFVTRRMDSGPLGQHSLDRPSPTKSVKAGFCNQPEKLVFCLV